MFTLKLLNSSFRSLRLTQRHISVAPGTLNGLFKSGSKQEETVEVIDAIEEEVDPEERQKWIDRLRNKSRLNSNHRNLLHDTMPYRKSQSWVHDTLKYKRKMYARFGEDSNVDPRICFWTEKELKEQKEYERVAFPHTVQEMMAINEQQKTAKRERILAREAEIEKNLAKLEGWKHDITARHEKKEIDARLAKERKDRLIDEVRRHFGFTLDPKDERFKEMLEAKEKEAKKAMKESKRQAKEAKMVEKLLDGKKTKETPKAESAEVDDEEEEEPQNAKKK